MNIKQTGNGVNGQAKHVPSLFAQAISTPAAALSGMLKAQGYVASEGSKFEALLVAPGGRTYVVSGSLELVTPAVAEKYLAGKAPNRKSSKGRVALYAREMAAGQWMPASQGIAFDADGRLIDGEHRLRAVIEAGAEVILFVMRGLPPAAQMVVDVGRTRNAGDQLNIETGSTDGKMRIAVARQIHLLRTGWLDATDAMSTREQFNLVDAHAKEIDWVLSALPRVRSRVAPAPVLGAWAYAYGATPAVAEWAESYATGAGLAADDSLLILRNWMLKVPSTGSSQVRMDMALKASRALWAKYQGHTIAKLYGSTEGLLGFAALRRDDIARAWAGHSTR